MSTKFYLSKNSLLRRLGGQSRTADAAHHRRLLMVAVLQLVLPDGSDIIHWYRRYRGNPSRLLTDVAQGIIPVTPNSIQAQLNRILPHQQAAHLYVAADRSRQPSHSNALVKQDGLWRPRSRRINVVSPDKPLPRGGVLAVWPQAVLDPDVACGLALRFERILTGGRSIQNLLHEVQDCYSVRQQMTHCALVVDLLIGLPNGHITVRESPGKAVFAVEVPDNAQMAPTSGFVEPWRFAPVRIDPYAPPVTRPRVIIWADAAPQGLGLAHAPRCILPQIKSAVLYKAQGHCDTRGRFYEEMLLEDVLFSRLLPFCGIGRGNERVDIYGLSYDPCTGRTAIVAYVQNRTLSACGIFPVFTLMPGRRRTWTPNARAVELLKGLLFEDNKESAVHADRQRHLGYVFTWLGVREVNDYVAAFTEWQQSLTLSQANELEIDGVK